MPKISALTIASTLDGTEEFPVVQSSTTVKTTIDDIIALLVSQVNTYTAAQRGAFIPLTSTDGVIDIDLDESNNFSHTLTEDTTLAAPTNAVAGQSGVMIFEQGGEFALDCDPFWRFPITCPSISGDEGELAVLSYIVGPGATYALCSWGESFVSCGGD